jgi:hypothetical protein
MRSKNIHTHMHYVIFDNTVCICAANDKLTEGYTFYIFIIFYTMGSVARAIVVSIMQR